MVASVMEGRTSRQCRERYCNHVDEAINRGPWTAQEDAVIIDAQSRMGNKWIDVAALLPGRTANSIKNRWNATLLPRLRRQMAPRAASCPIYNMDAAMPAGAAAVTQGAGQKRCAESSLLDYRLWGKRMCPQEPGASPHASSSGAIVPADTLMGMHDLRSAQWSMLSHLVAQQLQQSALPVPVLPQLKLLPKAGHERAAPARAGATSPSSTEYGASQPVTPSQAPGGGAVPDSAGRARVQEGERERGSQEAHGRRG
eukprot:Tamp_13544.p1 GENE.Tamp_13544~~Tamp_13544.p1  ORF type:complete len:256 (-),score=34.45 Tamp_13544:539-1306(-)